MLPIQDYLKYNNVALIDPTQDFHANCADQYKKKGYLSPKQLAKLREWCHSVEAIERLTVPSTEDFSTPFDEQPTPQTSTKSRWSADEDDELRRTVSYEPTEAELLNEFPHRSIQSLKQRVYKLGGFYRKGKFYLP